MKRFIILLVVAIFAISCGKRIIVHNFSDVPREGEVVEVDLYELGSRDIVLLDGNGNIVQSQITYDDKLLFLADVPAMGSSTYRVKERATTADESHITRNLEDDVIIAVLSEGKPIFASDIDKTEYLDNGPLRYSKSILYFPAPVDTMWVKQRRIISEDINGGKRSEKVWFEDLKGEHEIMTAVVVKDGERYNIAEDSLSFTYGDFTLRFLEPLNNIAYRIYDKMYLAGFCIKDGPEPLEFSIESNTKELQPLEVEICGSAR